MPDEKKSTVVSGYVDGGEVLVAALTGEEESLVSFLSLLLLCERRSLIYSSIHTFLSAQGAARLMGFYRILQSCRQVQSLPCTLSSLYIKSISLNFPAFVIYTETGARCEICRHSEKYSCDRFYCLLIERKYEPTSTFFSPVGIQKYHPQPVYSASLTGLIPLNPPSLTLSRFVCVCGCQTFRPAVWL